MAIYVGKYSKNGKKNLKYIFLRFQLSLQTATSLIFSNLNAELKKKLFFDFLT